MGSTDQGQILGLWKGGHGHSDVTLSLLRFQELYSMFWTRGGGQGHLRGKAPQNSIASPPLKDNKCTKNSIDVWPLTTQLIFINSYRNWWKKSFQTNPGYHSLQHNCQYFPGWSSRPGPPWKQCAPSVAVRWPPWAPIALRNPSTTQAPLIVIIWISNESKKILVLRGKLALRPMHSMGHESPNGKIMRF